MQLESIGELIATRTLNLINKNSRSVTIEIGKPQLYPDGEESYYCPFKISGLKDEIISHAGGADGVQALLLCLERIGIILKESDENRMGNLVWHGSEILGFPHTDSSGLLTNSLFIQAQGVGQSSPDEMPKPV